MESPLSSLNFRTKTFQVHDGIDPADHYYVECCQEKVDKLKSLDLFAPEYIMERMTIAAQYDVEDKFEGPRDVFDQIAARSAGKGIDMENFVALLCQNITLPSSTIQGAGPIIFHLLIYAASLPFPSRAPSIHLSLDGMIRALAILSPPLNPLDEPTTITYCIVSRARTKQDNLRIIFEGLATPGPAVDKTPFIATSREAMRDEGDEVDEDFYIDISREDPRTTDLLDALVASQPNRQLGITRVARGFFSNVARDLLVSPNLHWREPLSHLRISRESLRALLKLAYAVNLTDRGNVEMKSEQALEAFGGLETDSFGWASFVDGAKKTMPNLIAIIEGLLGVVFKMELSDGRARWFKKAMSFPRE